MKGYNICNYFSNDFPQNEGQMDGKMADRINRQQKQSKQNINNW